MADGFDRDGFINAIRSIAGENAVARMIETKGGTEVRVSGRAIVGHWLTDLVGIEKAQKILDQVTVTDADGRPVPSKFYMPLGTRSTREQLGIQARQLLSEGFSVRDIGVRLCVSNRTASRMVASAKPTSSTAAPKRGNSKPRIGLLETLIIEGRPDSEISSKTGQNRKRIATRRLMLRQAGLLRGSP